MTPDGTPRLDLAALVRTNVRDAGKRAAGWISVAAGRRSGEGTHGVLVYHRIVDPVPRLTTPTWNVPPKRFELQLRGLQARGVRFAPLARVLEGEPAVAVTFDDIFGSVVAEARPILNRLGIPATAFVASAHVGAERLVFDDWTDRDLAPVETTRAATLAELRAFRADGHTIGAHTHTHGDFRDRPRAFEADLRDNLRWLHDRLGVVEPALAFPYGRTAYGYAGGELSARAEAAGVAGALTTDAEAPGPDADPFAWPRANVYSWDTPRTLLAKLAGHYAWAPRVIEKLGG